VEILVGNRTNVGKLSRHGDVFVFHNVMLMCYSVSKIAIKKEIGLMFNLN
jgi:hypothetical protein